MFKPLKNYFDYLYQKPIEAALIIMVITSHLSIILQSKTDTDIWGRIQFGNDVLSLRSPYLVDTYSYVTNHVKWVDIEWLSGVIYASVFDLTHNIGLIIFKAFVICLILFNIYSILQKFKVNSLVIVLLLGLTLDLMSMGTFVIRAHLFTYLFVNVLIYLLIRYRYEGVKFLYFVPLIFPFWVNMHGGFVAGLCFYGFFVVLEIIRLKFIDKNENSQEINLKIIKALVFSLLLSLLATLLNPWGIFLLKTILVPDIIGRPEITEWQPLGLNSLNALFYLTELFIAIWVFVKTKEKIYYPEFLIFVILSLVPFLALRHLPLFAVTVFILIAPHLKSAVQNSFFKDFSGFGQTKPRDRVLYLSLATVVMLLNLCFRIPPVLTLNYDDMPYWTMKLLKDSNVQGNLVVYFDWGEYLIYHLQPNIKVSLDPRRELVYPKKVYKDNFAFMYGVFDWTAILTKYDSNMVLVPMNSASYNLMKLYQPYEYIFHDNLSAFFVKKDFGQINQLRELAVKYSQLEKADKTNEHVFP